MFENPHFNPMLEREARQSCGDVGLSIAPFGDDAVTLAFMRALGLIRADFQTLCDNDVGPYADMSPEEFAAQDAWEEEQLQNRERWAD